MNELLQRHGCSNVFSIPEGLKELMADISREVLRDQPPKIFDYIANYLSALLITREHGIMSVKILDDLCDCRPSVSEHLMQLGMQHEEAQVLAEIIKKEIEGVEPEEGKEKVKEIQILKKILAKSHLEEEMAAEVCQVARNAHRDYWYRKRILEKDLNVQPHEAWEVAVERTLDLYRRTKPSYSELTRATQKIQAAYRGYYVRRNLLRHLKPKKGNKAKVDLPGPPADVAASREIDLGPVINVRVREEDTAVEFEKQVGKKLHLSYDPMKTITHVTGDVKVMTVHVGGRPHAAGHSSMAGHSSSAGPLSTTGMTRGVRLSSFKGSELPDPLDEAPYKLPHLKDAHLDYATTTPPSSPEVPEKNKTFVPIQSGRISFAQKLEEIVEKGLDDDIPEELPGAESPQEEIQEVPEDIAGYDSAAEVDDSAAEGGDSFPIASDAASSPGTDDEEE